MGMVMEEGKKVEPLGFGYPALVRPGRTRVGWVGIGVMGGAMATRLLAAGFTVTAYARTSVKADALVAAGASVADSPASVAAASDVVFTMVSDPGDVRAVVLDRASGALAGLRPGGVLVDCTSSSPSLAREIAAAARSTGCHAVDAPVSGGDAGARDGTLAILAGGTRPWQRPEQQDRQPDGGGRGGGGPQRVPGLRVRSVLVAVSKGAAGSCVMDIFGTRAVNRDFASGPGSARYIIKDLGMALEIGDGQEEDEATALPGAALFRQMFSAMVANGDGDLCVRGLITVIERLSGIHK
uniref:6-phosphogluconate dehydrogenase NADP-binding domain-containing protein n=1 Tax=Aegilops tauschii TaxID=37682 RepID=M8B1I9_AEGTA